mmetsp:Transcript_20998/g.66290  ORF Transcript_20998/g.66290 Transcript_20998/m.66290 type:complete len:201 (+) Transcript_20998:1241-1843(+)
MPGGTQAVTMGSKVVACAGGASSTCTATAVEALAAGCALVVVRGAALSAKLPRGSVSRPRVVAIGAQCAASEAKNSARIRANANQGRATMRRASALMSKSWANRSASMAATFACATCIRCSASSNGSEELAKGLRPPSTEPLVARGVRRALRRAVTSHWLRSTACRHCCRSRNCSRRRSCRASCALMASRTSSSTRRCIW